MLQGRRPCSTLAVLYILSAILASPGNNKSVQWNHMSLRVNSQPPDLSTPVSAYSNLILELIWWNRSLVWSTQWRNHKGLHDIMISTVEMYILLIPQLTKQYFSSRIWTTYNFFTNDFVTLLRHVVASLARKISRDHICQSSVRITKAKAISEWNLFGQSYSILGCSVMGDWCFVAQLIIEVPESTY